MKSTAALLRPIHFAWAPAVKFLFVASAAAAQSTGTIQGRVVSASDAGPLAAAQLSIPGTGIGGLSNADGRFTLLDVPVGQVTVRATLLGYSTAEQTVAVRSGAVSTLDFSLGITALAMDELIVTGTGAPTERRRLSADVDVLTAQAIEAAPASSVTELLQGRIAGAQIQAVSAQPGMAANISFRGPSSVMASQTPVIYVDGVRVDTRTGIGSDFGGQPVSALADLTVADIARIEITKGGAASTLYGADAASGVIQIFTKRGGTGETRITARMEQGIDLPETKFIHDVDFAFPADKFSQLRERDDWDPNFTKNQYLRNGHFQSYYLGVAGGTDIGYNISGRIQDSDGVQPINASTMYSLHAGVRARLNDALQADFSGQYLRHNYQRLPAAASTTGPLTAIEVGDLLRFSQQDNLHDALDVYLRQNIAAAVDRFTLSSSLSYSPSPLFDGRATIGIDKRVSEQRRTEDLDFLVSGNQGFVGLNTRDFTGLTVDLRGTFSYDAPYFTSASTTLGLQGFRETAHSLSVGGEDLGLPGVMEFDAAATYSASEARREIFNGGVFFLQQFGVANRLFLEGGLRVDGNTAFGRDVAFQAYPKVGASYDLAGAGFWPDWVGTLRLRANYGETGKFPPPFVRDRTFQASPFLGESAPRFDNPGNPELAPERVTTFEAGLDAALWDGRVAVQFTAFHETTTDALFFVNEQPASGLLSQLRNVGSIRNRGIEVQTNFDLIRTPTVGWSLQLLATALDNEVTDMGGVAPFELASSGRREYGWIQEGNPVGVRYMNYPIDTNGDGLFDDVGRGIIQDPETGEPLQPYPTSNGSIGMSLTLPRQGLTVSARGDWARGGTVMDYGSVWSNLNGVPRIPFPMRYDEAGNELEQYTYLNALNYILVKGDYLKLRELSARYELPGALASGLGAETAAVSLSVRNVFTWVPAEQSIFAPEGAIENLLDPELAGYAVGGSGELALGGSQSIALPPPRQLRFGVELTF